MSLPEPLYPPATRELGQERKRLAPRPAEAFRAFSESVFAEGALPAKTKQLIEGCWGLGKAKELRGLTALARP